MIPFLLFLFFFWDINFGVNGHNHKWEIPRIIPCLVGETPRETNLTVNHVMPAVNFNGLHYPSTCHVFTGMCRSITSTVELLDFEFQI